MRNGGCARVTPMTAEGYPNTTRPREMAKQSHRLYQFVRRLALPEAAVVAMLSVDLGDEVG